MGGGLSGLVQFSLVTIKKPSLADLRMREITGKPDHYQDPDDFDFDF